MLVEYIELSVVQDELVFKEFADAGRASFLSVKTGCI